ncbi:hypothetical protein OHV05_09060 [Kitasatospora sp. NBC_00070]|uniref:hypothetical protein n=1 Tax=Kitasatospora sp. NBC_00070 TaxID=2975962 RepID=UPI0032496A80
MRTDRPGKELSAHAPEIPSDLLADLLRRAVRLPLLAAKYRQWAVGGTPALHQIPVLRHDELARVTEEVLALRTADGTSSLWAVGGSLTDPELSLLPHDLGVRQLRHSWRPLGADDVLANLHPLERLRPNHHFFNRFAAESGTLGLAFGRLPEGGHKEWAELLTKVGVTAVAAPPETVTQLLGIATANRPLPWLRTLLLGGMSLDSTPDETLADCLPNTRVWRLYGSPATGTVAQRGPRCLDDVYHPLPTQHVEIVAGLLVVTTLDPARNPPLIRYETEERGEFTLCACGRPGPAVRLFGAASPYFRMHGHTVSAQELADLAVATGDVRTAQVVLDDSSWDERVQLRVRLAPGVPADEYTLQWIRYQVLTRHLVLASCVLEQPDAFEVVTADELADTASPALNGRATVGSVLVRDAF